MKTIDALARGLEVLRCLEERRGQRLAELHRASVTLDANPAGQGTLARIVFPRSHLQAPPLVQGDVDALV